MRAVVFVFFFCQVAIVNAQDYWQQHVDYAIEVELDDSNHILRGFESVEYTNNSPDTLDFLIFHLWPKAYSNKRTSLAKQLTRMGETSLYFATPDEMGDMDSLAFTLDGLPCAWELNKDYVDICTLKLEKPLLPKSQVLIETPFRVKIPSGEISRLGYVGESFQITQWYPKPAVYDQTGWHGMPYLTIGEFYSEFGSYDVKITLPENYTVGATGDLQTSSEIDRLDSLNLVTKNWLSQRQKENSWSEYSEVLDFPESSPDFKTLHYFQDNVHDSPWFADKRFHVLKGSVSLPHSSDSVTVWTMFTNKKASLWNRSIEYMSDAIYYYSLWNGDYPYKQATAIDGTISAGGGMEYPNVTVIGDAQSSVSLETVIMHEVGHNWFYGILGSNERDFAWMDEGLNSYNEQRYLSTKYPKGVLFFGDKSSKLLDRVGISKYGMKDLHYFSYLLSARANMDQPLSISSSNFSMINYGTVVYSKSAVFFNYLRSYLGDQNMDQVMKTYFEDFKYKHPQPDDFFNVLDRETDKNIAWMENDVIKSKAKLDYKIGRVRHIKSQPKLKIVNRGQIYAPLQLGYFMDGQLIDSAWIDGFRKDTVIELKPGLSRIEIDPFWIMPEIKRDNNYTKVGGVLPRIEPLKISLGGAIEDPRQNQVSWIPTLAANVPNGFMPGISFYNSILPVKKFNYLVSPMYSIRANQLVGFAEAYYMLTPTASSFESLDFGVKAKRFVSTYDKSLPDLSFSRIEPYVRLSFRPPSYNGYWVHELTFSSVIINEDEFNLTKDAKRNVMNIFNRANYSAQFKHPVFKTDFSIDAEQHVDFLRTSMEIDNKWRVTEVIALRSRVFAGYFLINNTTHPKYNWRMDGQTGINDYAFDALFIDRSGTNSVFDNQLTRNHGGFKTPIANGNSNQGLVAYNAELKFGKFPIGLFGDVGYSANNVFVSDGGLYISLIKEIFKVYFPLVYSSNIQTEIDANGYDFGDLVRFEIDFNKLNLMNIRRKLSF